jgi:DhnA family fructose-bisphosphate aldolase class Ia
MGRLFDARSRRCLNVAVDHGLFGEAGFLRGIENMPAAIEVLVDAGPDAIQLTRGQASLLQVVPGKGKPALVLRADVANVYGVPMEPYLFSTHFRGRELAAPGGAAADPRALHRDDHGAAR